MFLTLFTGAVLTLASLGTHRVLGYFENKPEVTVFFKKDTEEKEILAIKENLATDSRIAGIKYINQEEALKIYREQYKKDPLLLEMVAAKDLPASLEISVKENRFLGEIAAEVKKEKGLDEVIFPKEIVESLLTATNMIRKIGIVLVGFLLGISFLVIVTVMSIKVTLRRQKIEISQLLGATGWFIRLPFLMEGAVYGILGGALAFIAIIGGLFYLNPFLEGLLGPVGILPLPIIFYLEMFGGIVASGIFIGTTGTFLAVWRYLK